MKVAISATLFAAYFVFVHSTPIAAPGEQLTARKVDEVPVFPTYVWSTSKDREDAKAKRELEQIPPPPPPFTNWPRRSVEASPPPLFSEGSWARRRAVDAAPTEKRDVESADKEASPEEVPLWYVTDGGIPGWSKRDTEGVAYPQEAPIWTTAWGINPREAGKRDTEEVAYTEEAPIWWTAWGRPRREVEGRAEPPPVFPGSDWRERREVPSKRDTEEVAYTEEAPIWWSAWGRPSKRDTEGVAYPQEAPIWASAWGLIPGLGPDGKRSEPPPPFPAPGWVERSESSSAEIPPPFNGEIGWRLRNPTPTEKREVPQSDVEEREVPPPFDFREWNWAGKRLAEAEAKAAATKRMIPPPSGSEFNLFTGGNGWPTPRSEKRMIPPPSGKEFNVFTGGGGWPTPRAEN